VTLEYKTLVTSRTAGKLLTVDLATAAALITRGPAAFAEVVNPALRAAEEHAPEGAWLLLDLRGWTLPIVGNVGPQVARGIQTAWEQGAIRYQEGPDKGRRVERWPVNTFGGRFAVYDPATGAVRINAVKRQGPIVVIILVVLGVLVGLALIQTLLGQFGDQFTLSQGIVPKPKTPPPSGIAGWWDRLSYLDKAGIVIGTAGLAGFGLYVWGETRIHAAGATRSEQNIIIETAGGGSR
jgi:hypothetical protein